MELRKPPKRIKLTGEDLELLAFSVWERDGGCCNVCNSPIPEGSMFHHIEYKSEGGSDVIENGISLCLSCHNLIHDGDPDRGMFQLIQRIALYYGLKKTIQFIFIGMLSKKGEYGK